MAVGRASHMPSRGAVLLLLALVSSGCSTGSAEPSIVGEPLPGSFYLTSDRPAAYPLTIRWETGTRSAQFDEGDSIVLNWSTLPLPEQKRIDINGQLCEGTFTIEARIETDLLLSLKDDGCRVDVLGC